MYRRAALNGEAVTFSQLLKQISVGMLSVKKSTVGFGFFNRRKIAPASINLLYLPLRVVCALKYICNNY